MCLSAGERQFFLYGQNFNNFVAISNALAVSSVKELFDKTVVSILF